MEVLGYNQIIVIWIGERCMKRALEFLNKLPSVVLYILFIALLGCIVYAFPRLSFLIGSLFQYGMVIFFIFIAILCIIVAASSKHSNKL